MCYLQMLSPIKILEYRQIQTSIWVMFQNCTFKSIICNSEHIFPQKQWQAGLERPILPMMYLKCGSIQKSTVETQIKKKKKFCRSIQNSHPWRLKIRLFPLWP